MIRVSKNVADFKQAKKSKKMWEGVLKRETEDPAQALVALHDSMQNYSKNISRPELNAASSTTFPGDDDNVVASEYYFEHKSDADSPLLQRNPFFTFSETRTMKGLLTKLNNSLKQSSCRRWVYYEWFYSNIDRAILLEENDFESCLQHLFKELKTRKLTKAQWSVIRRMMGKPRRCSAAFFAEERRSLEEKRKKIRHLHQLKGFEVAEIQQYKDLPEEIPMPMVVGTKITAKVHPEGDGIRLFTGVVDAVDSVNNTYRVNFDREDLGSHSVADTEVRSETYESMNLQLFIVRERPTRIVNYPEPAPLTTKNNALKKPFNLRLSDDTTLSGTYGGFPVKFLLLMTKLVKVINEKRLNVVKLKEMNCKAEINLMLKHTVTAEFKNQYATLILELEKINKKLTTIFSGIQEHLKKLAPQTLSHSETLKVERDRNAEELIAQSQRTINSARMRQLVTRLTALMLHIHQCTDTKTSLHELDNLEQSMDAIRDELHTDNVAYFRDHIETSVAYLKTTLKGYRSALSNFDGQEKTAAVEEKLVDSDFEDHSDIDDDEDLEDEDEDDIDDFEDFKLLG